MAPAKAVLPKRATCGPLTISTLSMSIILGEIKEDEPAVPMASLEISTPSKILATTGRPRMFIMPRIAILISSGAKPLS